MVLTPPLCRGMTVLNRDAFKKTFEVLGIRIPAKQIGLFMKSNYSILFNQPRLRNVVDDPTSKDTKLVLLKPGFSEKDIDTLPQSTQESIREHGHGFVQHPIDIGYDYWTSEQIFHAVMPEAMTEIPSSFTQVGHIAHFNLREECYPWKHLIGQVTLDKIKNVTCVVNKTSNIDATFRFFQMEVLAGDGNMIAEVKENNCRFKFDFSKVYWNSRLHTEHERLVSLFKPGEYVGDIFAGVGPFALPAAKKGCRVFANDLNPSSFEWLKENKKLNKITDECLKPYNLDGREFIRQAICDLQKVTEQEKQGWRTFDHFVMNLPATAIEFLDAFRGVYRDQKDAFDASPSAKLPMIHCHCFTKDSEPEKDITERVQRAMGLSSKPANSTLHLVRNVAPKKDMYCISFPLAPEVAFASSEKRKHDLIDDGTDEHN